MKRNEETAAARALARLKEEGCAVFAQYEYLGGEEHFRGILISPRSRENCGSLERIAEIITSMRGLTQKKD